MAFRVEISPRAFDDLDQIAEYIKEHGSFEIAERWFNGILDAITALAEMPRRCPVAEESDVLGLEVRMLLYGKRNRSYKVFYTVNDAARSVRVLHVRHWARKELESEEFKGVTEEPLDSGKESGK